MPNQIQNNNTDLPATNDATEGVVRESVVNVLNAIASQLRDENKDKDTGRNPDRKAKWGKRDRTLDATKESASARHSTASSSDNVIDDLDPIEVSGLDSLVDSNREILSGIKQTNDQLSEVSDALYMFAEKFGKSGDGHDKHSYDYDFAGFSFDHRPHRKRGRSGFVDHDPNDISYLVDQDRWSAFRRGSTDTKGELPAEKTIGNKIAYGVGATANFLGTIFSTDPRYGEYGQKQTKAEYVDPILDYERAKEVNKGGIGDLKLREDEEKRKGQIAKQVDSHRRFGTPLDIDGVDSSRIRKDLSPEEVAEAIIKLEVTGKNTDAVYALGSGSDEDKAAIEKLQSFHAMYSDLLYDQAPEQTDSGIKEKKKGKQKKTSSKFGDVESIKRTKDRVKKKSVDEESVEVKEPFKLKVRRGDKQDSLTPTKQEPTAREKQAYVREKLAKANDRAKGRSSRFAKNPDTMNVKTLVVGKIVAPNPIGKETQSKLVNAATQMPDGGMGAAGGMPDVDIPVPDGMLKKGWNLMKRGGRWAGRFLGPAAAVASAGYTGYEAGEWLNEKMNNAEEGSAWASARDARNSTFDSVFSGIDNLTGGMISGNADTAKKNWEESSGGKLLNNVKSMLGFDVSKPQTDASKAITPTTQVEPQKVKSADVIDSLGKENAALKMADAEKPTSPVNIVNNSSQVVSGGGQRNDVPTMVRPVENAFQRFINRTYVPY